MADNVIEIGSEKEERGVSISSGRPKTWCAEHIPVVDLESIPGSPQKHHELDGLQVSTEE
jgi:hypothetical protein